MRKSAKCPSCLIKFDIGLDPRPYQRFICPECDAFLEIIKIDPPVLDWSFENGEEYYDSKYWCFEDYIYSKPIFDKRW